MCVLNEYSSACAWQQLDNQICFGQSTFWQSDCFKTLRLLEICRTPSPRLVECTTSLGRTLSYIFPGCATSKQQCLHSSAESEIIALDAGLRTDGLPALQF